MLCGFTGIVWQSFRRGKNVIKKKKVIITARLSVSEEIILIKWS